MWYDSENIGHSEQTPKDHDTYDETHPNCFKTQAAVEPLREGIKTPRCKKVMLKTKRKHVMNHRHSWLPRSVARCNIRQPPIGPGWPSFSVKRLLRPADLRITARFPHTFPHSDRHESIADLLAEQCLHRTRLRHLRRRKLDIRASMAAAYV